MRLGMNFGHRRNARAQHRHGVMRGEQFSGQTDVGKIPADGRCALVSDKAVPTQCIDGPLPRPHVSVCQLLTPPKM